MKHYRLFLTALAAVFSLGLSAQSWTGNEVAAGKFFLYNVGTGTYLCGANDWGTHSSVSKWGVDYTLEGADGIYTLESQISNGGDSHYLAGNYTDGAATNWTFEKVSNSPITYTLNNGDGYLAHTTGTLVEVVADGSTADAQWILVSYEDIYAAMEDASESSPMDVRLLIPAGDIGRNNQRNNKWNFTYSGGNNRTGGDNKNFIVEAWNSTFEFSQTLTDLPVGYYKVSCSGFGTNGSTYIFAGNVETPFAVTANSGGDWAAEGMNVEAGDYAGNEIADMVLVTDGTLKVGVKRTENISADWALFDKFILTYYGAPTDLSSFEEAWEKAVAAADAALEDNQYANVTGSELNAVTAAKADKPSQNKDSYIEKTSALNAAVQAFKDAAPAYNAFEDAKTIEQETLPYASSSKYSEFVSLQSGKASNADDAIAKTESVIQARRIYVESNAMAEAVSGATDFTNMITNPIAANGTDGWTRSGVITRSGEGYTNGDGIKAETYFDSDVWGSNSATASINQDVELEAGRYLLSVTSRASAEWDSFSLNAGDESIEMQKVGNQGNVFGNGWNDQFVEFETDGSAPVTISVAAVTTTEHQWFSVDRFRLVQLEKVTVDMATDADYAALNKLISEAEENTLGFESGENAPYNNVEALIALEAAKAIDQDKENTKKAVQNAIDALNEAEWTANNSDVAYLYNGDFAIVEDGGNYPKGWKRTNAWGQMRTEVEGADNGTAYYNQPGSLVYGDRVGYSLPLKAGKYDFSCKYRSHEDNSNTKLTINLRNVETSEEYEQEFDGNPSKTDFVTAEWTIEIAAGNYVLTIKNGGNTWITDVKLVKHDEATGIEAIQYVNDDTTIYNLSGQRVQNPQKGVFIMNGKKVVVK